MARNEWFQYNGKWYYFGSDGAMYFSGSCDIDGIEQDIVDIPFDIRFVPYYREYMKLIVENSTGQNIR